MRVRDQRAENLLPTVVCPDCGAPMRLAAIFPTGGVSSADEVTYRCDPCRVDLRRTAKPPQRARAGEARTSGTSNQLH
jgi:hypothetical protein